MARETKFRSYITSENRMTDVCTIDFYSSFIIDEEWVEYNMSEVILMQFTWLYDKNNQPIFESDIVSIWEQDYTYKSIWVVEYEWCWFEIDRTLYWKSHWGHNLWLLRNYLTVIWNLYEHPHLLTDNQWK